MVAGARRRRGKQTARAYEKHAGRHRAEAILLFARRRQSPSGGVAACRRSRALTAGLHRRGRAASAVVDADLELLPLLRIAERDPDATVVLMPADHYLRDEEIMVRSLRRAAELAKSDRDSIYLLGVEPDEPDTELGYILPASRTRDNAVGVARFIEKPSDIRARALVDQGALWNAFIMAASVTALLGLFDSKYDTTRAQMRGFEGATIEKVYQRLSSVDFSHDVLQGKESLLKVLTVPHCGWTDLGTPKRIGLALQRMQEEDIATASDPYFPMHVNLADQYARLHPNRDRALHFGRVDLRA